MFCRTEPFEIVGACRPVNIIKVLGSRTTGVTIEIVAAVTDHVRTKILLFLPTFRYKRARVEIKCTAWFVRCRPLKVIARKQGRVSEGRMSCLPAKQKHQHS